MSATCHCGAEWGGLRTEHCTECHQTFNSGTAGDMHRVGEHHVSTGPKRRRCRTEAEMLELGMTRNALGRWISSSRPRDLALAMDTPSGRLPVRTPGAALEEGREVMDDFQRAMNDFQMEPSAENLTATREVIERWPA